MSIERGGPNNEFDDYKLNVIDKLKIPDKTVLAPTDGARSFGLGPNDLLVYTDHSGQWKEVPIDTGKINDAVTSNEETWSSQQIMDKINSIKGAISSHPTYVAPSVSLFSGQGTSGLEIGQSISIPLATNFSQNDAGLQSYVIIKRGGVQIATVSPYTDNNVVISATPKVYQAEVGYNTGAVKNDTFGDPDQVGRILAGSVLSNSLSFRGYYKSFFGPLASGPANSAGARGLASNALTSGNLTVVLNTGTTLVRQVAVLAPGYVLDSAIDLDASGAVLTYALINSNFTVNDFAGTPVAGFKVYERVQGVPYGTNHRHQLTIKAG